MLHGDHLAHAILQSNMKCIQYLKKNFPECVVQNKVVRSKLAEVVFHDSKKLQILQSMLFPKIKKQIQQSYENMKNCHQYASFIVELPLLHQTLSFCPWFDEIVLVSASHHACWKRFMHRGFSSNQFVKRLQYFCSEKQIYALPQPKSIIYNDGSIDHLKNQINKIFS